MFLSTFEKQLDSKRRLVLPQEFRAASAAAAAGRDPFEGVFCFPSIEADCLEGGGPALLQQYQSVMADLPFGDPVRSALEFAVLGQMRPLSFDTAGRIVLPESLCEAFGLSDWVAVVGLGDRFQIWPRDTYRARLAEQRKLAREGLVAHAAQKLGRPANAA